MSEKKVATRDSYGAALVEYAAKDPDIVVLDADLAAATKTGMFKKAFPERFIDCGIAECNMIGVAAGLAAAGKKVFASSFAMFAAGRAFEVIRNSVGYPHLPVKICATHAGISVGEDGATHQCCEDLAFFEIGKGIQLKDGRDVTILATGLTVSMALEAANTLEAEGISTRIINIHTIKPLDEEIILKAAKETGLLITVEEHNVIGGFGSAVSELCCEKYPVRVVKIGVNDVFGKSGPAAELLKIFGLSAEHIVQVTRKAVSEK